LFGSTCELPPVLVEDSIEIFLSQTTSETVDTVFEAIEDMAQTPPPQICTIYKPGSNTMGYENDTVFETTYMDAGEVVFKRNSPGTNTTCSYATQLGINAPISTFLDYAGALTLSPLETAKTSTPNGNFSGFVNTKALWYKIEFGDNSNIVLELSEKTTCDNTDDIPIGSSVRITTFNSCSTNAFTYSQIVDLSSGEFISINKEDYPSGIVYLAIDSPILAKTKGFVISPTCGCFNLVARTRACLSRTVTVNEPVFSKRAKYETTCTYKVPINDGCTPSPYKYGKFAYWESTETYPDNSELYDSSNLVIDISKIPVDYRAEFSKNYYRGGQLEANFACQPIRHFKTPDFAIAPFMTTEEVTPFGDSLIYPLGITIDEEVVNYFLDVAVDSSLITQEQRNSITGYKLKIGDRSLNKSIVAKGIVNDMFSYTEVGATNPAPILFPNFPYNDLRENKLLYTGTDRKTFIQSPNNGVFNNNFLLLY